MLKNLGFLKSTLRVLPWPNLRRQPAGLLLGRRRQQFWGLAEFNLNLNLNLHRNYGLAGRKFLKAGFVSTSTSLTSMFFVLQDTLPPLNPLYEMSFPSLYV